MITTDMPSARHLDTVMQTSAADGLAAGVDRMVSLLGFAPADVRGVTLLPCGAAGRVERWQLAQAGYPAADVGVSTSPHPLAGTEGLEAVRVTPAPDAPPQAAAAPAVVAAALLAVRVGVLMPTLDAAVAHLSGRQSDGSPLIGRQLLQAAIADVAAAVQQTLTGLRHIGGTDPANPAALLRLHVRVGAASWEVIGMFGASGYLRDHLVRRLYVADLMASCWIGPAAFGTER